MRVSPRLLASLFVASMATLALEVAQVRIFSYALDPLLVFSAISVAMLGMGVGAVVVTLQPKGDEVEGDTQSAVCLGGFALSTLLSHIAFAKFSPLLSFDGSEISWLPALALLAGLLVPYIFVGIFMAWVMARSANAIGRIYALNMAGSAAGCIAIYPLLRPLGLETLLVAICATTALSAWLLMPKARKRLRSASLLLTGLCCICLPLSKQLLAFQPDPSDLYAVAKKKLLAHDSSSPPPLREFNQWDPVSKVEVYRFPGSFGKLNGQADIRLFAQDGGAGSMLVDLSTKPQLRRGLYEGTVYGAAYAFEHQAKDVLVIGLGGGPDVLCALHHEAESIVGIELNRSTIDLVRGTYAKMLGDPYGNKRVRVLHRDGRSFLERNNKSFDIIQMTGADTYAAGSSGAFMFSESYLYTVEAFEKALRSLKPQGVLAIIRFGLEPMRVVATAIAGLRRLGIKKPERHIVVIKQGIWVSVLIRRSPLNGQQVESFRRRIETWTKTSTRIRIPIYEALGFGLESPMQIVHAPGQPGSTLYSELLRSSALKLEDLLLSRLALDFSPVDDNRPFFFQYLDMSRLGVAFASNSSSKRSPYYYYARGLRSHFGFLLAITIAAAAALLLPLARRKVTPRTAQPRAPVAARGRQLGYFGCIGLGYLMVELTLMQKSALLLGHPTHSVTLTLVALLLGSGLGSWLSDRPRLGQLFRPHRTAAAVALLILGLAPLSTQVFAAALTWSLPLRVLVQVAIVFPTGLLMGLPFPGALREIQNPSTVAWCVAVNSFASVWASLMCVPVAMFAGFRSVFWLSAALYALAALLARPKQQANETNLAMDRQSERQATRSATLEA